MHEWSLVQALLERVAVEARAAGATAVHRIHVCIGEAAGVEPDLFARAFEDFRVDTVCSRAELEISRPPARWECPRCGRSIARGERLQCAGCLVPARLVQGDEILLQQVELEVR